jgi:hypothetical protein
MNLFLIKEYDVENMSEDEMVAEMLRITSNHRKVFRQVQRMKQELRNRGHENQRWMSKKGFITIGKETDTSVARVAINLYENIPLQTGVKKIA